MGFVDVFYVLGVLIRRVPEDLKMVSLLAAVYSKWLISNNNDISP